MPARGNPYNAYHFLHTTPANGNNYYRLKVFDNNGRFTYSSIIWLGNKANNHGLSVHPNPVVSVLNVTAQSEKDELVVFNLVRSDGKVAATKQVMLKKGSNAFSWNVGNHAAGNYFIHQ